MDPTAHPIISALSTILILFVVRTFYLSAQSHRREKSLGCEPGVYGPSGPFGLGFFLKVARAAREGKRIQLHEQLYKIYGNTFKQKIPSNEILFTIDTENIKAILTSQFNDFSMGHRTKPFWPLLGDGIFNADGHVWSHARSLLRPQFTKDQVNSLLLLT
jgi:cytochrome P450